MARGEIALESSLLAALPSHGTLIVAVSGGADSVALLLSVHAAWLRTLKSAKTRKLIVVHVNHKLRAMSSKDEAFVKALAKRLKIPFYVRRLGRAPKSNIEAWARTERYRELEEFRKKLRGNWILTAHNQNDVAETFLIKLLQNRDSYLLAARDKARRLIRPLVSVDREQIERYLVERKQAWREDETNLDVTFARNWVRLELLPLLKSRWGKGVFRTLAERADAQQVDRFLADSAINNCLADLSRSKVKDVTELRSRLMELPAAAHPLFGCAIANRFLSERIGRTHGASVARLILGKTAAVQLPHDQHLTVKKGLLSFHDAGKT